MISTWLDIMLHRVIDCVLVFGKLSNVKLVYVHYLEHWHTVIKLNV